MKVLFAVSDDKISEAIVKEYKKQYKEIITYKNVYYFNAIIKEVERDQTYDRIVISEELEPFTNNNYDAIDKFMFEKLDNISDEITRNTSIILICADRRSKGETLISKLFGIGLYNALMGTDRNIPEVCRLLRTPRSKKQAKIYYGLETDEIEYQKESEDSVSENEIQNILAYYKKNEAKTEKYAEVFDNIASQYNDTQLKLIIKYLPLSVKAVLETDSEKYQSIMTFTESAYQQQKKNNEEKKKSALKMGFIETGEKKNKLSSPVIVPSAIKKDNVTKLSRKKASNSIEHLKDLANENANEISEKEKPEEKKEQINTMKNSEAKNKVNQKKPKVKESIDIQPVNIEPIEIKSEYEDIATEAPKKKRGRPKKQITPEEEKEKENKPKRGRGRPKKEVVPEEKSKVAEIDDDDILKVVEDDDELINAIKKPNVGEKTLNKKEEIEEEDDDLLDLGVDEEQQENDDDFQNLNVDEEQENDDFPDLDDDEEEQEEDDLLDLDDDEEEQEEDDLLDLDDDEEEQEEDDLLDLDDNEEEQDDDLLDLDDDDEPEQDEDDDLLDLDDDEEPEQEDDDLLDLDDDEEPEQEDDDLLGLDDDEEAEQEDDDDLLGLDDDEEAEQEDDDDLLGLDDDEEAEQDEDDDLLGLDDDKESEQEDDDDLLGLDDDEESEQDILMSKFNKNKQEESSEDNNNKLRNSVIQENTSKEINVEDIDFSDILTPDRKLAAFIGTSKNGTSFLVNNLAMILADMGIKTAILDLTKNKNSYYIFTKNEEDLRKVAYSSFDNLKRGIAQGISVNRNLTVYTALPGVNADMQDVSVVLPTLIKSYGVVLLDCDFETPINYFAAAQEIYLVQSMDILTIQPLTYFLKELKSAGINLDEKARIIINKEQKVKNLSKNAIIGGLSSYNDPAMSYMTKLFDKDKIINYSLPLDVVTGAKYLETLVTCELSLSGYSKNFIEELRKIAVAIQSYKKGGRPKRTGSIYDSNKFSSNMNSTLDEMKRKY